MQQVPMTHHPTSSHYSPHDLLPAPVPAETEYPTRYFYENVAKHLIKDTVRIISNGIHIDLNRVTDLEAVLNDQLAVVATTLANNPIIQQFLSTVHSSLLADYLAERRSKLKTPADFLKPFNHKDKVHRSYFMNLYAAAQNITPPTKLIEGTELPQWDANLVKKLSTDRPLLARLLSGELTEANPLAQQAMEALATHKCDIHNRRYLSQIEHPTCDFPPFNPGSSTQKKALFSHLGYESETTSKDTGEDSWNRDEIDKLLKMEDDPVIIEMLQAFVDHSFAAIVRNNFIKAFYNYTVDSRLYGNIKLFGAKTFRPTSQNPNLLNLPSTKSIFAKPIKRCFTAPPGRVILSIDYSALENRVVANLAHEQTLIKLYNNNLDGHCVHAIYYFKEEVAKHMPLTGDIVTDSTHFAELVEAKHSELKAIRQRGKGPSLTHKRLHTVMYVE